MSNRIKFTIPGKKLQYTFNVESLPLGPQMKKELRLDIAKRLPSNIIPLHACVISDGDNTILISGASKSGKSTLAHILKKLGFRVVANDFVASWLHDGDIYASDINLKENNQDKKPMKIDQIVFLKPKDPRDMFRLNLKQLKILYRSTLTPLSYKDLKHLLTNPIFKQIYKLHYCLGNCQTPQRWLRCIKNTLYGEKPSRIGIIGLGTIGQDLANLLIREPWLTSLSLYSPNQNKLAGAILDLKSANPTLTISKETSAKKVFGESDLVVLCFNQNNPTNILNTANERHRKILVHSEICNKIAKDVRKINNFNGTVLVVTNPVDFLSWYFYQESGLLSNQVYGVGLGLDYKRLKTLSLEKFEVIGEHGDEIKIVRTKNNQLISVNNPDLLSKLTSYSNRIRQFTSRTRFGPVHEILSLLVSLRRRNATIRVSTKYGEVFLGQTIVLRNRIPMIKYKISPSLQTKFSMIQKNFGQYKQLTFSTDRT